MDYKVVEIAGKNYPLKFGNNALRIFQLESGQNILKMITSLGTKNNRQESDFFEVFGYNELIILSYAGLKDGSRKAKSVFDLEIEDVADLMDEDSNAIVKILQAFTESITANVPDAQKKTGKIVSKK